MHICSSFLPMRYVRSLQNSKDGEVFVQTLVLPVCLFKKYVCLKPLIHVHIICIRWE